MGTQINLLHQLKAEASVVILNIVGERIKGQENPLVGSVYECSEISVSLLF